ncbi:hypothetical protein [Streptomyces sp. NPDC090994]|uniref:hypothetical protein n=1 Tax=Streptomyces sp. NPDC090994 TaxID=3365969 RepID=UPI00382802B0
MRTATVPADGDRIRRAERPGRAPSPVHAHGPAATSPARSAGAGASVTERPDREHPVTLDHPAVFAHTTPAALDG